MQEICTSGSVGTPGGKPPGVTRAGGATLPLGSLGLVEDLADSLREDLAREGLLEHQDVPARVVG